MLQFIGWSLLASVAAVTVETYARMWGHWTWWFLIPALIINIAVVRAIGLAPGFMFAFVLFSLFNLLLRSGVSVMVLHEPLTKANAVAMGALLVAVVARVTWR